MIKTDPNIKLAVQISAISIEEGALKQADTHPHKQTNEYWEEGPYLLHQPTSHFI